MRRKALSCLWSAALVAACQQGSQGLNGGGGSPGHPAPGPVGPQAPASPQSPAPGGSPPSTRDSGDAERGDDGDGADDSVDRKLDGDWESGCTLVPRDPNAPPEYPQRSTLSRSRFKGHDQQQATYFYNDDHCGARDMVMMYKSRMVVRAGAGGGPRQMDLEILSHVATMKTEFAAQFYRDIRYCGISDWRVGVEVDVSRCPDLPGMNAGDHLYTIYEIDGSRVYFGGSSAGHDGRTEAGRYDELRRDWPFRKQ
jgi:hypothetical protein